MYRAMVRRIYDFTDLELLEALELFRRTDCSEPKDKLYAPLTIVQQNVAHQIVPDYSKSLFEVYLDVAKYHLAQNSLDFLGFAGNSLGIFDEDGNRWPSWLPDWRKRAGFYALPRKFSGPMELPAEHSHISFDQRAVYHATVGSELSAVQTDTFLNIKGIFIDEIVDIISIPRLAGLFHAKLSLEMALKRWPPNDAGRYFTGETLLSVVTKTLVVDVQRSVNDDPLKRYGDEDLHFPNDPDESSTEMDLAHWTQRDWDIRVTLESRVLIRTKRGFIGIVHEISELGDNVFAFLGSNVLHSVRKEASNARNCFEYIGECYLHGLMDGEVMKWIDNGSAQVEEIMLC
jgi:hypothetical protein